MTVLIDIITANIRDMPDRPDCSHSLLGGVLVGTSLRSEERLAVAVHVISTDVRNMADSAKTGHSLLGSEFIGTALQGKDTLSLLDSGRYFNIAYDALGTEVHTYATRAELGRQREGRGRGEGGLRKEEEEIVGYK